MNSEKAEYDFLVLLNKDLDGRIFSYKDKIKLLGDLVGVKQQLLETIEAVLPKNYTDRIITKSKKEDYIGKQMKVLEFQQHLLRKQVKGILKGNDKKPKATLIIDNKRGVVVGD